MGIVQRITTSTRGLCARRVLWEQVLYGDKDRENFDVEEAGDLVGEAAVHVVDEGIEDLGSGRCWKYIIICEYRRN